MSTKALILPIDPSAPSSQSSSSVDVAKLWSTVPKSQKTPKVGSTRTFYDTPAGEDNVTTLVSLGEGFEGKTGAAKRELVRKAVGSAVKDLKALVDGETSVAIDASADPHAAGELFDASDANLCSPTVLVRSRCGSLGSLQVHLEDRSSVPFQP